MAISRNVSRSPPETPQRRLDVPSGIEHMTVWHVARLDGVHAHAKCLPKLACAAKMSLAEIRNRRILL